MGRRTPQPAPLGTIDQVKALMRGTEGKRLPYRELVGEA